MGKIRVCVVGYGNVGKEAIECIRQAPDMELAGVVRRNPENPGLDCPVVSSVDELGKVDVAVLTSPSRLIPAIAPLYLEKGINTVDSFDIHGDPTLALKKDLDQVGKAHGSVAIISAGWDPGTDSVFRVLFAAMAPRGITYTNFGPGMSMGHTVAVKAIPGEECLVHDLARGVRHSQEGRVRPVGRRRGLCAGCRGYKERPLLRP